MTSAPKPTTIGEFIDELIEDPEMCAELQLSVERIRSARRSGQPIGVEFVEVTDER